MVSHKLYQGIQALAFLGNERHLTFLTEGVEDAPTLPWLANDVIQTNDYETTKGNKDINKDNLEKQLQHPIVKASVSTNAP